MVKTKEETGPARQHVERRASPRIKTDRPVTAQALEGGRTWEACLLDISTEGAGLRSSEAIPVGTEVRVDARGILLAGTVTRCDPDHGAYNVGVKLLHPLSLLTELARLNMALLGDDSE
jgi:PilZ domain